MRDIALLYQQAEDELSSFDVFDVTGVFPLDLLAVLTAAAFWCGQHPENPGSALRVTRYATAVYDSLEGFPALRRLVAGVLTVIPGNA